MVNTAHCPHLHPHPGDFITSLFPDSFSLTYYGSNELVTPVTLLRRGITWYTDKNIKYRNPNTENMTLAQAFNGILLLRCFCF